MELQDYLKAKQKLLEAQLKTTNELLQQLTSGSAKKKTQIETIIDILNDVDGALHIKEIISLAKEKYNVNLDRETIVSSIAKKIAKGSFFKRVAPNTYDLIER
jgi:vacuolar-type H+-ATPase subunit D/Vma8